MLGEITFCVIETHSDQWKAEITGAFQVIAREHSQAAGIYWQGLVQTKFGGEVSDRPIREFRMISANTRSPSGSYTGRSCEKYGGQNSR